MAHGFVLEPHTFANVTASNTETGYQPANVGDDIPARVWKSTNNSPTQWLTFDLGADKAVDTVTLHGLRDAQASWDWTVELATAAQGPFTGSFFSDATQDLLAGSEMPVSGLARAIWQAPLGAPDAVRYVRLAFSSLNGSPVEVSRACIGAKLQLSENFSYPAALGIRALGSVDFNIHGVPLIRKGAKLRGIGLTCEGATRGEVERQVMPLLERIGNDTGIALVIDPAADAQRQQRIYFGFLTGDLGTVWPGYNRFVWNVNLVAVD